MQNASAFQPFREKSDGFEFLAPILLGGIMCQVQWSKQCEEGWPVPLPGQKLYYNGRFPEALLPFLSAEEQRLPPLPRHSLKMKREINLCAFSQSYLVSL